MEEINLSELSIETSVSIGYTNDPGSNKQYVTVTTKLLCQGKVISESKGEDYLDI